MDEHGVVTPQPLSSVEGFDNVGQAICWVLLSKIFGAGPQTL